MCMARLGCGDLRVRVRVWKVLSRWDVVGCGGNLWMDGCSGAGGRVRLHAMGWGGVGGGPATVGGSAAAVGGAGAGAGAGRACLFVKQAPREGIWQWQASERRRRPR